MLHARATTPAVLSFGACQALAPWLAPARALGHAYLAFVVALGGAVDALGLFAVMGRWVVHGP